MEILSQKQPNFFVESVGRYNQRSVQEYLVDSSTPKTNLFSINWKRGPFIDDVVQSDIGDCWLIASIQSLLETGEGGKENIKRIFKYIVNEKVNGEEKPKWVVLRLYPIKLYVEYRDDITAFKIISVPNPKPVDIHINIQEDNIIKELGQGRYEFKGAGEWVKYIEMAFKKFYRNKYITFVGNGWEDQEHGGNYIYRHLNDALMGLKTTELSNGKKIQNNIDYGYPFVGVSVLSGKKMESSWMDVAMGYGEDKDSKPKTPGEDSNEKKNTKKYAYRKITSQEIKIGTKIIKVLDRLKKSAEEKEDWEKANLYIWKKVRPIGYFQANESKTKTIKIEDLMIRKELDNDEGPVEEKIQKYKLSFQSPYHEPDKKFGSVLDIIRYDPTFKIQAENDDKAAENNEKSKSDKQPNEDLTDDEIKRGTMIVKVLDKLKKRAGKQTWRNENMYFWDDSVPIAFLRKEDNSSHVMRITGLKIPRQNDTEKSSVIDKIKTYKLDLRSTYSDKKDPLALQLLTLIDIIRKDPTFSIISEGGEKAKNHSVEKSKKSKNDINERIKKFKK